MARSGFATDFRNWLEAADDKVFWITGKPGSGKSTLMKFLRDHESTDAGLRKWADGHRLLVADHFFWLPGNALQNSVEGLLRALLHDILKCLPTDLSSARTICGPKRWSVEESRHSWSLRELKAMIMRIRSATALRLFFLIDGLDECSPKNSHDQLIDLLLDCSKLPNSKLCISSRPWEDFKLRLNDCLSIELDTLTRLDMLIHADDRLVRATLGQAMDPRAQFEIEEIAKALTDRAYGVFLWVELMLREMEVEIRKRRGLQNLRNILEDFPLGLDEYFAKFVYERISKASGNISDTASVLKLASLLHEAKGSMWTASFIPFWLLSNGAYCSSTNYPTSETAKLGEGDVETMLSQTRAFLHESCNDLLVLSDHRNFSRPGTATYMALRCDVNFFHRTVYDYIMALPEKILLDESCPTRFKNKYFVPRSSATSYMYELLSQDNGCLSGTNAFFWAIAMRDYVEIEHRFQYQEACESFALKHLSCPRSCLGLHTAFQPMFDMMWDFSRSSRFMRATVQKWPHTGICDLQPIPDHNFKDFMPINCLKRGNLCGDCARYFHDCLCFGLAPLQWLESASEQHSEPTVIDISIWTQGSPDAMTRESILFDTHVRWSHVPQRPRVSRDCKESEGRLLNCEICDTQVVSSRYCDLKDVFLTTEYTSYIAHKLNQMRNSEALHLSLVKDANPRNILLASMPFDLPTIKDIVAKSVGVSSTIPSFSAFVWRRQKLKAVKSLLTSLKKQFHALSSSGFEFRVQYDRMKCLINEWVLFLRSFAPNLDDFQQCRCDGRCKRCDFLPQKEGELIICLACDEFPQICEGCFSDSVSAHERDDGHPRISIRYRPDRTDEECKVLDGLDVMPAMMALIDWYVETAPLYGLDYTIPSHVEATRGELGRLSEEFIARFASM